jgi:hypothetical protein
MNHIYPEPLSLFLVGSCLLFMGGIIRHRSPRTPKRGPSLAAAILSPLQGLDSLRRLPAVLSPLADHPVSA